VIARSPHLQEDRLLESYFADRRGDPVDPRVAEHLVDCDGCNRRYAELAGFMNAVRDEAEAEVDALYPPERLRAQQSQIERRLEHLGRAARVISFPGRFAGGRATPPGQRIATRWVAAAAAAGLFVGAAASMFFDEQSHAMRAARQVSASRQLVGSVRPTRLMPVGTLGSAQPMIDTDADFLTDLDVALERPRTRELQPFDALTPHVRPVYK